MLQTRSLTLLLTSISLLMSVQAFAKHNGEHLYVQNCVACHGYSGSGGMGVPLSQPDFLATVSNDYLVKTIRKGRPGRVMPAFKHLSDAEVDSIVNYIRSWSSSLPPKYTSNPVQGNAAHGEQLYQQHCASCHGADLESLHAIVGGM